jgi:predicted Zn-dependent peptidase
MPNIHRALAGLVFALVAIAFSLAAYALPQTFETTLPNGLKVIMIPDSRAEMAVSYAVVDAGVRHETPDINGVTHFLEHMLFNGTESLTQEELYARTDQLGAYNNAFTRKDFTAFMMLAPSRTFPEAFAVQADMILHSTLPPEKLEKERGIVIEEINQGLSDSGEAVGDAWDRLLWAGTPYEMTTLGPKSVIASITREKVVDYYHHHYAPNSTTLLLIGDFQPKQMLNLVQQQYGGAAPQEVPAVTAQLTPPSYGLRVNYFEGVQPSVRFAIPLERAKSPFAMLASGPSDWTIAYHSPTGAGQPGTTKLETSYTRSQPNRYITRMLLLPLLEERLEAGLEAAAGAKVDITLDEESYLEGGYVTGSFMAENEKDARKLAGKLPQLLADAVALPPDADWLARKRQELIADELKQYDNFLYYGMFKSYLIAQGKWALARDFDDEMMKVTAEDMRQEGMRLLGGSGLITMVSLPYPDAVGSRRGGMTAKRFTLDNGLTVLLRSDPRSEVFGASVLFRNRSFAEPAGQCGITELWQRVLSQGPAGITEDAFNEEMSRLGLSADFVDNPFIPMDDIYLSNRYSFIKLEGLDAHWRENLTLLAMVQGMKAGSPRARAGQLMQTAMFGDHPLAKPVEGITPESQRVSVDDLTAFARKYAAGGNMILSVVTSAPAGEAEAALRKLFGGLPAGPAVEAPMPSLQPLEGFEGGEGSPQAAIYFAFTFDGYDPTDEAAVQLLGGLISDKAAFVIREEHGLAYSIGAGFDSFGPAGWFTLYMGTGAENVPQAKELIVQTLGAIDPATFSKEALERQINSYLGRRSMRRITRKNQAFFAAKAELYGMDDESFDRALEGVTLADVQRVFAKYFTPGQGAFFIIK